MYLFYYNIITGSNVFILILFEMFEFEFDYLYSVHSLNWQPIEEDLSFDDLLEIQGTVANEFQEGSLGTSLNVTVTSLAMTDPVDTPVDPTEGVRATNETGGPSEGNQTWVFIRIVRTLGIAAFSTSYINYTLLPLQREPL